MQELSVSQMETISGAGWLQDSLASIGGKIGDAIWKSSSNMLSVDVPLVGTLNLATFAPDMGMKVGTTIGSNIGGDIEAKLSSLPTIGSAFAAWFNR